MTVKLFYEKTYPGFLPVSIDTSRRTLEFLETIVEPSKFNLPSGWRYSCSRTKLSGVNLIFSLVFTNVKLGHVLQTLEFGYLPKSRETFIRIVGGENMEIGPMTRAITTSNASAREFKHVASILNEHVSTRDKLDAFISNDKKKKVEDKINKFRCAD